MIVTDYNSLNKIGKFELGWMDGWMDKRNYITERVIDLEKTRFCKHGNN